MACDTSPGRCGPHHRPPPDPFAPCRTLRPSSTHHPLPVPPAPGSHRPNFRLCRFADVLGVNPFPAEIRQSSVRLLPGRNVAGVDAVFVFPKPRNPRRLVGNCWMVAVAKTPFPGELLRYPAMHFGRRRPSFRSACRVSQKNPLISRKAKARCTQLESVCPRDVAMLLRDFRINLLLQDGQECGCEQLVGCLSPTIAGTFHTSFITN